MAKRSRKESNSSEDEGGGEQEEEKEEGEASDEDNEWKIYCTKKDNETEECEETGTLVILKIKLEIKACSKKRDKPIVVVIRNKITSLPLTLRYEAIPITSLIFPYWSF